MRILFLLEYFWPTVGGVEVRLRKFLPDLRDRGFEVLVVTARDSGDSLAEQEDLLGIRIERLPLRSAFQNNDLRQITALRRRYAQIRSAFAPNIIHTFFAGIVAMLETSARFPTPVPLLASFTTWPPRVVDQPSPATSLLQHSTWITANSKLLRDALVEIHPALQDRSSVIYSGHPAASNKIAIPLDPPVLLCVGRCVEQKGLDLAIQALPKIVHDHPGVRLRIAGDGPFLPAYRLLADSLEVGNHVDLLGWVHPDRIAHLIDECSVAIVPSRGDECFATIAIQAAQRGRPLIVSHSGGMPESVVDGQTGFLVNKNDANAISEAVNRLLGDRRLLCAMGDNARRRAASLYSWDAYVDRFEALYRSLKD